MKQTSNGFFYTDDMPCDMSTPEGESHLKPCDENIMKTIMLADQMLVLADQGDAQSEDAGCGILYGIMRDSAYKILQLAEEEKQKHINKGWWRDRC